MNPKDFNAWAAEIDLLDSLSACEETRAALGIKGKRYEDLMVAESVLADLLTEREKRIKNRPFGFQVRKEIGIGVVNPSVRKRVLLASSSSRKQFGHATGEEVSA